MTRIRVNIMVWYFGLRIGVRVIVRVRVWVSVFKGFM